MTKQTRIYGEIAALPLVARVTSLNIDKSLFPCYSPVYIITG